MSKLIIVIIALLFIAVVIFYYFVFTGVIVVERSNPTGAKVHIDGVAVGSPPLKQRVRAGVHQIMIYKEGFETRQEEIKVSGFSPLRISVRLRFILRSEPAGARVTIDSKYAGTTDIPIELRQGVHTFEFQKRGYQVEKFRANIPEVLSESIPVVTLEPERKPEPEAETWSMEGPAQAGYGSIQVTSTPDAQVYLDGELQGETPLTIKKVPAGSYVISLSKEGYREMRQTVYVRKDETTKVAGELKPGPQNQTER